MQLIVLNTSKDRGQRTFKKKKSFLNFSLTTCTLKKKITINIRKSPVISKRH